MMMVCNVAVIVDGCLVDLNTYSEIIATTTFSLTRVDVVLLSFGEIIPFRVSRSLPEVASTGIVATSVNDLSCGKWVTRV